jgi:hypothetical protein
VSWLLFRGQQWRPGPHPGFGGGGRWSELLSTSAQRFWVVQAQEAVVMAGRSEDSISPKCRRGQVSGLAFIWGARLGYREGRGCSGTD